MLQHKKSKYIVGFQSIISTGVMLRCLCTLLMGLCISQSTFSQTNPPPKPSGPPNSQGIFPEVKDKTENTFKGMGSRSELLRERKVVKDSIITSISDTLWSKENDIETTVEYNAADSTIMEVSGKEVYLYGNAIVTYGEIELKADYIKLNWEKSEIYAHGMPDSTANNLSKTKGKPVFKDGSESYVSDTIRYNFKSKKAIIKGIVTQQGEGIVQGEKVKKDPLDNLYMANAKYTTCNLAEPHFHIAAKRLKLAEKKSVVSGPFNLVLAGVPLPIGLPFGFFPVPKKKEIGTSGFIMGNYGEEPNARGFYLRDFGYYHAFNEYIGAKVLAQVYSRGSFGIGVQSNYIKRYKVTGNLNLQFNYNKPSDTFSSSEASRDFNISWSHSPQSLRSDRSFSASVNLVSNSFAQNNRRLDEVDQYTSNTFGSSVQFTRNVGQLVRTSFGLRADQNVATQVFNGSLSYNVALNQFNPFVPQKLQSGKWYDTFRIGLDVSGSYTINNAINARSTSYTDYNIAGVSNTPITNEEEREIQEINTLLNQQNLSDDERSSLQTRLAELTSPVEKDWGKILDNSILNNSFRLPISLPNFKILKYINLTPSISLQGDIYTKSLSYEFANPTIDNPSITTSKGTIVNYSAADTTIRNTYDDQGRLIVNLNPNSGGVVVVDTLTGVKFGFSESYGASMNTRLYGTYKFNGKGRLSAIRHTLAPSVSFNYSPDNAGANGYAVRSIVSVSDGDTLQRYLPKFINSTGSVSSASSSVSFTLTNQLEAKLRSKSDTAESEFVKLSLLDNLSLNGSYNLLADTTLGQVPLSNITMSTNTSLFKNLININANASFDPYAYAVDNVITSNLAGRRVNQFKWNYNGDGGDLLTSANFAISTSLSPKTLFKEKAKQKEKEEEDPVKSAMQKFIDSNPMAYVDFSIPWSVNINYSINYNKQGLADARVTQAISMNSDLSLTKNWKLGINTGWDFEFKAVTLTTFQLMRQLHCWDMSFNWTPIAGQASRSSNYSFDLRVRSSLLSDLRVSRRRQYYDRGGF